MSNDNGKNNNSNSNNENNYNNNDYNENQICQSHKNMKTLKQDKKRSSKAIHICLKEKKGSESHVLLKRKFHKLQVSKTKFNKQNKK